MPATRKRPAPSPPTGIPAFRWDVGDHEACIHNCNDIAAEYGPIDIVINNAGITRDGVLHKMSFDDWNEVMRINLGGCFNMAKATFPGMRERGWGRIVNIGSINGQAGQYGQVNYAAAKSGIHGFTKALAQEGAKFGVTVNAIAPGLYRYRHGRRRARPGAGKDRRQDPGRSARPCRGDRPRRGLPHLGQRGVHHRLDHVASTAASTCIEGVAAEPHTRAPSGSQMHLGGAELDLARPELQGRALMPPGHARQEPAR
jgi:NAD(P)-dependent dehydrogenase (short-subunit alcohol dehydrogenase family)